MWSPYLSELTKSVNKKPSVSPKIKTIVNNIRENTDFESDASF